MLHCQPKVESQEAFQFKTVGWVARLFSGVSKLEEGGANTIRDRGQQRIFAICNFLDGLDEKIARRSFSTDRPCIYREAALAENRDRWKGGDPKIHSIVTRLLDGAEKSLKNPLYSVVDKTTLPPSGDPHDYWHPAPYWWPNPETDNGLPYIYRDGERIEGTRLYEPQSDRYDRTRLQLMFDETTTLALGWYFSGKMDYADRGAQLVRQWFINPETRMNPHLRFSQVRLGHNNNQGSNSGLIETKDFYFLLDAVRLLGQSGAWTEEDRDGLREWLLEFKQWLEESPQGKKEVRTKNNHGTYFDLQIASIYAYLDDVKSLSHIFQRSQQRIVQQIIETGEQPEELARTTTAHYCTFNLEGLLNLARLAECVGYDLWSVASHDGRSLKQALKWLVPFYGRDWPFQRLF
ncbi:MAG: alginate lyase family protein [Cyanobacteria bacterium P01_F01_bin.153]